ncbi:trimethylamine monooxygenase-like [Ruditapes philippinarum]|uniref:trimethylamine monooxygenase-like n=1 Tax=Ruditapes philippinarum TaxID=129788 RepID=UPI00295A7451|nr:trimethylamine monooxygenase-like [Ruditapes philippinarum]
MSKPRICVIGAGPSGLSTLFHFAKMEKMPEIVCYEKQRTWMGLWNVSWKTGLDENGEPIHTSQYHHMWCNGPYESHQYPDYPFEQHFGQQTPSFPPRAAMRDYLEGRFTKAVAHGRNLRDYIHFNTAVRYVKYNDDKDDFTVIVNDYNTSKTLEETFTHVIVASGIYSFPNLPEFPGMEQFKGRILHSHDFRNPREFSGQRVLLIGAGYTGEDILLQCLKFGAKHVIMAYRTRPKGDTCIMPEGIEERPIVERFDSNKAYFKDGASAEIDSVILTTGYRNYFPFLEDKFRIPEETHPYPEGLYKATLFYKEGNNRLFYIGTLEQFNSFAYFEVMASWTCRYIMGQLEDEPKEKKEMQANSQQWIKRANACTSESQVLHFQTELIAHLAELSGYHSNIEKNEEVLNKLVKDRKEFGLAKYRDQCYASTHTDAIDPKQNTPFMLNYDDSIEAFLKCK